MLRHIAKQSEMKRTRKYCENSSQDWSEGVVTYTVVSGSPGHGVIIYIGCQDKKVQLPGYFCPQKYYSSHDILPSKVLQPGQFTLKSTTSISRNTHQYYRPGTTYEQSPYRRAYQPARQCSHNVHP